MSHLLLACLLLTADPTWYPVASDPGPEGTVPPHLSSGGAWTFTTEAIPTGQVPRNHPARRCLFGAPLVFDYQGLRPAARYQLRLTMLSDALREQKLSAGGQTLVPKLVLPFGQVVEQTVDVPPALYAQGSLSVQFDRLTGPNAVVSAIEIWSTDATKLAVPPPPPPLAPPRLSPRPDLAEAFLALGGTWRFSPAPPAGFEQPTSPTGDGWHDLAVPGEWFLQGFTVAPNTFAGYRRDFEVPARWAGQRLKLKADSVFSECRVWVNGQLAGGHLGGFTPFELDVTALVKPGTNTLALAVKSESVADRCASGSQYANHPLGGILRKLYLFPLPPVNVAALHYETRFDAEFKDATLKVLVDVANESDQPRSADLRCDLGPLGGASAEVARLRADGLQPGEVRHFEVTVPVTAPLKWDQEHPECRYTLTTRLDHSETVTTTVGFRQIDVRGNQLYWNNVPIKLRGVCRHEVHPLTGRADTARWARRDAELFRAGHCNFIRTSHYPPTEEFLDACDELGLLVGCEAPICWSPGAGNRTAIITQELEMVRHNRNHPCLVYWSLGNESHWGADFDESARQVRAFEPTLPRIFSTGGAHDSAVTELVSRHYPGLGAPKAVANLPKPQIFDEYIHLNCYNRRELETDPGLRDVWGLGFAEMWERMLKSPGCLGGSIWAAIDDTFFAGPDKAYGYGPWGPLDGWRRPKPEYWHMAKIYAPVRLRLPVKRAPWTVEIENRQSFTDLRECRLEYTLDRKPGTLSATAAPGETAKVDLPLPAIVYAGSVLELRVVAPTGVELDRERWQLSEPPPRETAALPPPPAWQLARTPAALTLTRRGFTLAVDTTTGQLSGDLAGPTLALVPLAGNDGNQLNGKDSYAPVLGLATGWHATEVTCTTPHPDETVIAVKGAFAEASGGYTLTFRGEWLVVDYAFTLTKPLDPRQLGLVFDVPRAWDTLGWVRDAQWSTYPADHLGRAAGRAKAFYGHPLSASAGPRRQPTWPYSEDANALGSNDFRATRRGVRQATLTGPGGGLQFRGDGSQALRAWVDSEKVRLLVADYDNEGAAPFFNEHVLPRRRLAAGATVSGRVLLAAKSDG